MDSGLRDGMGVGNLEREYTPRNAPRLSALLGGGFRTLHEKEIQKEECAGCGKTGKLVGGFSPPARLTSPLLSLSRFQPLKLHTASLRFASACVDVHH
jgi:hypothetical protein